MTATTALNVGDSLMLGDEEHLIVGWDIRAERVRLENGVSVNVEDIVPIPMPSDPAELARWLDRPTWAAAFQPKVETHTISCSLTECRCGCYDLVITRDDVEEQRNHFAQNETCACARRR